MMKSKQYDDFKKFVLKNKPNSKDKVIIPSFILSNKMDSVIKEVLDNQMNFILDYIQLQYEKSQQEYELSDHIGKKDFQKEVEKFKKDFFYETKKKLKRLI